MMLKLKLHYFGHLMRRVDSLEKTLMLGGIGGRRRREATFSCGTKCLFISEAPATVTNAARILSERGQNADGVDNSSACCRCCCMSKFIQLIKLLSLLRIALYKFAIAIDASPFR